jgi:N-acetylglucosamine-6-phosphate deacetylase
MAALGIDDGRWTMGPEPAKDGRRATATFRLGDREVLTDGVAAWLQDGTLAGSVLSLDQAVRNLVAYTGCTPGEAIGTVTSVPAKLMGVESESGSIAPGMIADLVLLAEGLRVAATVARGEVVYSDLEARV